MSYHPTGLPENLSKLNRTLVMGVLNATPDSFSDGGKFSSSASAISYGLDLARSGADIVDVGGESTRPGAERVTLEEELERTIPIVSALANEGICVSIDTMRAAVAREAIAAGAAIVNDVSGGLADVEMYGVIAQFTVPYILMHWRGHSDQMMNQADYQDVVAEVAHELSGQITLANEAGIASDRIVIDPGIGFAKLPEDNWKLLRQLSEIKDLGHPILVGASRKRFIGELLADNGVDRDVLEREAATTAITTFLAQTDTWAVRVHDVRASADAIAVVQKLGESDE
mgnify:CR=1 FL=1